MTLTAGTIYDVTALEDTTGPYSSNMIPNGMGGGLFSWNYCTAVDNSNYAKITNIGVDTVYANGLITPDAAKNVENAAGEIIGLEFVQSSDTVCASDSSKKLSFKTTVTCDASKTDKLY